MNQLSLFEEKLSVGAEFWISKLTHILKEGDYDGTARKAWKIFRKTEFPRLFTRMYLVYKKWIPYES